MSCPAFTYTDTGRRGVGVIQPQSGLDYPFVSPSDDIRYLVADFYLSYDDVGEYSADVPVTQFPLRIKYLLNIGCADSDLPHGAPVPTHAADVVIVDAAGTTILNTVNDHALYSSHAWSADYTIHEWTTDAATCRLVTYNTWKTGEPEARNYPRHIAPNNAVLDARAVHKLPKRLRSLSVQNNSGPLVHGPYFGNILFKNNYNTEIAAASTTTVSFVVNTNVTISAVAGSGAGYFHECGAGYDDITKEPLPKAIKQINGVAANAFGDFLIAASDCMHARRPTDFSAENGLFPSTVAQQQFGADCGPCCTCDDYVQIAKYMNSIGEDYGVIGTRAREVKRIHDTNVATWNDKRACGLDNPLKLILVPQCCPLLDVVMMVCNPCTSCYLPSTLTLNIPGNTFELVCGTATLYAGQTTANTTVIATPGVGGTQVTAALPAISAGSSAFVKFRLRAHEKNSNTITGVLTGKFVDEAPIQTGCPEDATRQAAVAQKSTTLNCSQSNTDQRCV